ALVNRLKADDDFRFFARSNWEDSRAEQAIPHPLEQRWIALAPYDLLIDLTRPVSAHGLAREQLAIDRELEILERGALWQREHEIRFANSASAIHERFGHFVAQHSIDEIDTYVAALTYDGTHRNAAGRHHARTALNAGWNWARPWPRRALDDLAGHDCGNGENDCQKK